MKKTSVSKILIIILLAIVGVPFIFMAIFRLGTLIGSPIPVPENKYGEFPFRIVYEIDGEQFTVEDVLICEYLGRNRESYTGREIKWDERLMSGNEVEAGGAITFLQKDGNHPRYGRSIKILEDVIVEDFRKSSVYIDIGDASYYLGYSILDGYSPGIACNQAGIIDEDILWKNYKVRIIEATFSPPLIGNGIDVTN